MLYRHLHRGARTKEEIPRENPGIPKTTLSCFPKTENRGVWRAAVKLFSNRSPFTAPPMLEKYCSNRANNNGADGFKPRSVPPPLVGKSLLHGFWTDVPSFETAR